MSDVGNNKRPIIIKRKKVIAARHHGGAWKVAYADFVTAMMAFFLLMWLLGATNEKQRKAIADYFNPTITINRNSGGGGSFFGGDSPFPEETLPHNGVGASNPLPMLESSSLGIAESERLSREEEDQKLLHIQQSLIGLGGETMIANDALSHMLTRVSDEGLIIEVFDLPDDPLFDPSTENPTEILQQISRMLVRVFGLVTNELAVQAHTPALPIVTRIDDTWDISTARAMSMRQLLENHGFEKIRIQRVTGFASRKPISSDPMEVSNGRLELILLRSDI
ncbi:flagellar motor protein MotB [Falsihalocynthiibacter sp. SS001]|uniref:flagellar motor protein MotB n=1 Tax=Falsihalocynthiibacter sp. SS001 TaxID=3349698 RepID=UPI0036D40D8D